MLVEFLGISLIIAIIGGLVALEVALLEQRRVFLPTTARSSARDNASSEQVLVADFILASRLVTCALLLVAGGLFGRLWMGYLSSGTVALPTEGIRLPWFVHYLAGGLLGVLFVSIVVLLSYLAPFNIAARFPDQVLSAVTPLGRLVVRLAWPGMALARLVGQATLRSSTQGAGLEEDALQKDIRSLVEQGERAGVIEGEEREIIGRVFKLGDKPVASLMTPRADVVFLNTSMSAEQALKVALEARYGWFPVRNGADEDVVGAVSAYDVFEWHRSGGLGEKSIKALLSTALDIPESMSALELLEQFKERGIRFAIVRDEYGEVAGVATVHDVLQALVGELGDGNGEARSILTRDDGSLLVDASSDVENLFELLECGQQLGGDQAPFHSVGGFVMSSLGQIPKEGDAFLYEGYRFEVVDMDGKRIDKVLVSRNATKSAVGV
jgi:putative hemolysin